MHSKKHPRPPDPLDLEFPNGKRDRLCLVGAAMQGWIFRSNKEGAFYRLIPILGDSSPTYDDAPLERRHELRSWSHKPRRKGIVPITDADHCNINGYDYCYVRYEIDPAYTLADGLTEPDRVLRLALATRALLALPTWWEHLYAGLLPMPAEIVFPGRALDPWLLGQPFRSSPHLPDLQTAVTEPLRVWYLAPELLRGNQLAVQGDNLDRYAMGIALWQCFYPLPEMTKGGSGKLPSRQIVAALHGTASDPRRQRSDMPFWLERVQDTKNAIDGIRRLLDHDPSTRATVNVRQLAESLTSCCKHMDPAVAVQWLLNNRKVQEAFDLLQDVLLERDSYELLVLAGDIAGKFLHRHLEAAELYEKAIERNPNEPEANVSQFIALLQGQDELHLALAKAGREVRPELTNAINQLDLRLQRNFERMSPGRQQRYEAAFARHMIKRGKCQEATQFIYPRLIDAQPDVWWKFDLALAYIEAFIGLNLFAEAQQQIDYTRLKLVEAMQMPDAMKEAMDDFTALLNKMEAYVHQRMRSQQLAADVAAPKEGA